MKNSEQAVEIAYASPEKKLLIRLFSKSKANQILGKRKKNSRTVDLSRFTHYIANIFPDFQNTQQPIREQYLGYSLIRETPSCVLFLPETKQKYQSSQGKQRLLISSGW